MYYKQEFIGSDFNGLFLQIGIHDEEELFTSNLLDDENLSVELDALRCLRFFPKVQNLILRPGCINPDETQYLYSLPVKHLKLDYYSDTWDEYAIDLGRFQQLDFVFSRTQYNFVNTQNAHRLKTLVVQQWADCDLLFLEASNITRLELLEGCLKSLIGLESLAKLRELSVSNQRSLRDLSLLARCPQLEILEIETCGKVNLDTIPIHLGIKSLRLIGRQQIESSSFFLRFPCLEALLLGMKVVDGDISSFLKLKHCVILTDYRHYCYRNSDLPKSCLEGKK